MKQGKIPPSQRATAVAACLSLALSCSSSGFAQKISGEFQTGSRIRQRFKPLDAESAGQIDKSFARCIYRKNRLAVDALLMRSSASGREMAMEMFGLSPSDRATLAKPKKFADKYDLAECLGMAGGAGQTMRTRLNQTRIRSMMAEEAYLTANKNVPVLPAGAMATLPRHSPEQVSAIATINAMAALADCITLNDTPKSDVLLRTMPGSDEERSAAVALAPVIGGCLVQGQTFKMTPLTIRALVADGMWARYAQTVN